MGRGVLALDRPRVVGIVNVTPDSFSDGGRFLEPSRAVEHAGALIREGADMLDLGAESTRPGRPEAVPADQEWARLGPVLEAVVREHPLVPLSVDTTKAETARRALEAGAWVINDVSGLRFDPAMATTCAEHDAGLVLMHSRGDLGDLASYDHATYGDLVADVCRELAAAAKRADAGGVRPERIVIDPGLGFAKTPEQNLRMLRNLAAMTVLGFPIMVGPSRKRFLGELTGRDVRGRDPATAAACVCAYLGGASLFRVHAVEPTREALTVAHAVRSA